MDVEHQSLRFLDVVYDDRLTSNVNESWFPSFFSNYKCQNYKQFTARYSNCDVISQSLRFVLLRAATDLSSSLLF